VLAPNSPLRAAVTALARPLVEADVVAADPTAQAKTEGAVSDAPEPPHRKAARHVRALLLVRI